MPPQGRRTVQNFGVATANATPKYWGGRWGGRNKGTPKYWGGRGHPGHPSSAGPAQGTTKLATLALMGTCQFKVIAAALDK